MTMATIDASIVIVAMPAIFCGIGLNPLTSGNVTYLLWMIMGYLLVQSVLVVTLGRLGDMFGRVKIYNLGFLVFTLASIALSLDPLTGPDGFGGLLAAWDWRAIFWINVPIGLFGTVWAYRSLREIATTRRASIDWLGNATFALGAGALLVAITYGIRPYGNDATGWAARWSTAAWRSA